MDLRKIFFIIVTSIAVQFGLTSNSIHEILLKRIQCNGSDEFVYKNFSCYVKPLNRSFSELSFNVQLKKPLRNVFVSPRFLSFSLFSNLQIFNFPQD